MLTVERTARLVGRLTAAVSQVDDALAEVTALAPLVEGREALTWLEATRDALQRAQLELADARYAAQSLRSVTPHDGTLQPRLL